MIHRHPYGSMWWGGNSFPGFLFKKRGGGGVRRSSVPPSCAGGAQQLWNEYVPGSGVGATSVSVRRSKLIRATACTRQQTCGRFAAAIASGQKPYVV